MTPWDNTNTNTVTYTDKVQPQEPIEPTLRRVVEKIEQIDREIAHKKKVRQQLVEEVYELTEYLKKWCDEIRHIAGPMQGEETNTSERPPWTSPE